MKNIKFYLLFSLLLVCVINENNLIAQRDYIPLEDGEDGEHTSVWTLMNDPETSYFDLQGHIQKDPELLTKLSDKERKYYDRWNYWWSSRVGKHGNYSEGHKVTRKFLAEEYQNNDIIQRSVNNNNCTGIANETWTSLGFTTRPSNNPNDSNSRNSQITQGKANKILQHPNNSNILFAAGDTGGFWKSINGGNTWVNLTDHLILCGVQDFAIHPTNPNIMYLATGYHANGTLQTGHSRTAIYTRGLLKTTNGGVTWTTLDPGAPVEDNSFNKVLIHPSNPNIIYALSNRSVYKSSNAGSNWVDTQVPVQFPYQSILQSFTEMLFDETNPNIIYISGTNYFYKSTNGGNSWTNMMSILSIQNLAFPATKVSMSISGSKIYCLLFEVINNGANFTGNEKIVMSTNGGGSWTNLPITNQFNSSDLSGNAGVTIIKVANDGTMYAGGVQLWRKFPSETKWQIITNNTHVDFRSISFPDPNNQNHLLIANDGGVWESFDNGDHWIDINGNMNLVQAYDVSISETDPNIFSTGIHDGGNYYHENGIWTHWGGGDGGAVLMDYSNNDIIYGLQNNRFTRVNVSNPSAPNIVASGLTTTWRYDGPIMMHPTNSNTLFASTQSSWKRAIDVSYDQGNTWQTFSKPNSAKSISAMDISKSNTNVFYYGNINYDFTTYPWTPTIELLKSSNAGATWSTVSLPIGNAIHEAKITQILIHPTNSDKLWVTFGNFSSGIKVLESSDGGQSWKNISENLENYPVQCIEYDHVNNQLYLGTDLGVYTRCADAELGGNSWTLCTGLPRIIISKLRINRTSGELICSTYGRGLWKVSLDGYCNTGANTYVFSNTTWNTDMNLCGDLIVFSGTLTISKCLTMPLNSTIDVRSGASLVINGTNSSISNSNIHCKSGSFLEIKNGAKIKKNSFDQIIIDDGAKLEYRYGDIIDLTQ